MLKLKAIFILTVLSVISGHNEINNNVLNKKKKRINVNFLCNNEAAVFVLFFLPFAVGIITTGVIIASDVSSDCST